MLLGYAAPWAAFTAAGMPLSVWFGKFSTDILLVPAAAVGTIVMIARLWDAVSDPLAGYWSDRTRSRLGRRRSWMKASVVPMVATLAALWSPPETLGSIQTMLWLGIAYIAWETASTAFLVPYAALGLELSEEYHERTRLFGWRHFMTLAGYAIAMGALYLLTSMEEASREAARETARWMGLGLGLVLGATVLASLPWLPEPERHQGRGSSHPYGALRDVLRNPHARLLLGVYAAEAFGMGSIGFMAPYVVSEVIGRPTLLTAVLAGWMIPQFLFTPLWMGLARRHGKKRIMLVGMALAAVGFGANVGLSAELWWLLLVNVVVLGAGLGALSVLGPAIQADIVDYDESVSGERKEGAYTATWNLLRKGGWGVAAGVGGIALGAAGYDGALEVQSDTVQWVLILFVSLVPAAGYAIGYWFFRNFELNESEHARIRSNLSAESH